MHRRLRYPGTSGLEFNLPDFSGPLTAAANMDMDGKVMGANGAHLLAIPVPPPPRPSYSKPKPPQIQPPLIKR